jgi:hypothetical protein
MRVIDTITHPSCRISIFQMNNKYLVKFEIGSYEQTYKFDQEDYNSLEELKAKINTEFVDKVIDIFRQMHGIASS